VEDNGLLRILSVNSKEDKDVALWRRVRFVGSSLTERVVSVGEFSVGITTACAIRRKHMQKFLAYVSVLLCLTSCASGGVAVAPSSWSVMHAKGYEQNAIKQASQVIAKDPKGPKSCPSYFDRGKAYLKLGEYDKASQDAQAMLTLFPQDKSGHLLSVLIALRKSDFDAALEHANRVASMDPNAPESFDCLMKVHAARGEWDQAIEILTRGISLRPNNPYTYYCRAQCKLAKGAPADAIADYDEAARLLSEGRRQGSLYLWFNEDTGQGYLLDFRLPFEKAVALDKGGRAADAVLAYKTFLDKTPSDFTYYGLPALLVLPFGVDRSLGVLLDGLTMDVNSSPYTSPRDFAKQRIRDLGNR
jgi:tetratricopeptide (TPR) repeat protein